MSILDDIKSSFDLALENANTSRALMEVHTRYFGTKGAIKDLFRQLKALPPEEKKSLGAAINPFNEAAQLALKDKLDRISAFEERERESREQIDVTLRPRLPRL